MISFKTYSPKQTKKLASSLARFLKQKDVLALVGKLGSGKTTFIKGIASKMGIKENEVISPSFVLVREYKGKLPIYHFDLYRLNYLEEVELLDYKRYFYGNGVTLIEWAEKIEDLLPDEYLRIELTVLDERERKIVFYPKSKRFEKIMNKIKKK